MYLRGGGKAGQRMPECRYGAACTRGDCIYRHPKRNKKKKKKKKNETKKVEGDGNMGTAVAAAAAAGTDAEKRVCLAYVAGLCTFTQWTCRSRHPSDEECEEIRQKFARIPCRFGTGCRQRGCLYSHPSKESLSSSSKEFVPSWLAQQQPISGASVHATRNKSGELVYTVVKDRTAIPQRWTSASGSSGDSGTGSSRGHAHVQEQTVRIPEELWTLSVQRDPALFTSIQNFMERFRLVNKDNIGRDVVDLHYQQPKNVPHILDLVLPQFEGQDLWLITGTGHHRSGHAAEGVLFNAVKEYLRQSGYSFKIGKDGNGYRGAFRVRG
eukprot:g1871.t1